MGAITVEKLEQITGKTFSVEEGTRMQLHVEAVNRWIEGYTGRVFGEPKTFEVVLDYDPVVFLPHVDIKSIEYVEVRGERLKEFSWNSQGRIVLSTTGTSFKGDRGDYDQVKVKYTTQYDDGEVPTDVLLAASQMIEDNLNNKNGSKTISSASTGGYSVTYGSGTGNVSGGSQSGSGVGEQGSVAMVLNAYRLRRV